ncbi:hypothetical protein AAC387_Pa01g1765 [Persea americana]
MTWMQSFSGSGLSSSSSVPVFGATPNDIHHSLYPILWFSVLLPMTSSVMVDHSPSPILWFYQCSHWVQLVPLLVS